MRNFKFKTVLCDPATRTTFQVDSFSFDSTESLIRSDTIVWNFLLRLSVTTTASRDLLQRTLRRDNVSLIIFLDGLFFHQVTFFFGPI